MIRRLLPAAIGLLMAAVPLTAGPVAAQADPDVVRIHDGALRGVAGPSTVTFQGIPYAAPPVGQLRWTPPRPPAHWTGVRDATKATPYCPQSQGGQPMKGTSEDCLYLHVTVPKGKSAKPRPVMVWSHGGGFSSGSGSQHVPTKLVAEGNVIVVTVDFRIGVFGNFGLKGLPGSGTFGMQDQQAALRWVRDNIGAFGGDSHNVTLFGESGGGVGTCGLLTSPGTRGLVDRAIMESGSCLLNWPRNGLAIGIAAGSFWHPLATVQETGRTAATHLGCTGKSTLRCLRDLDTDKVFAESDSFGSIAYGNPTLPLEPGKAIKAGLFPKIPILSGHTKDEARAISAVAELLLNPVTADNYSTLLTEAFGDRAAKVEATYPASQYSSAGDHAAALAWSAMDTDRVFACPQRATSAAFARSAPAVYAYEFADPAAPGYVPFPAGFPTGSSHASELNYLFDAAGGESYHLTEAQQKLAAQMRSYWTNFARTGNPNGQSNPSWPEWPSVQVLAPGATAPGDTSDHHCNLWK
ncbi:carboxylesterase family protein [Kribbella sp. NPDC051952]|uniref:carboxylesterase/lipase family protein n=1 Tax=Kribbella sp. NPDC051952 TaxID=3154851 RepID=UPI00341A37EC